MKNPKWKRDEVILALDLYFQLKPGEISAKNPKIIELSTILNKLPIHNDQKLNNKFRNANGVSLKLSNFLSIDPSYHGKGMQSFSKLDKSIFDEFTNDLITLKVIANKIKKVVLTNNLVDKLYKLEDENEDLNYLVKEGKTIYRVHKFKERNQSINKRKKDNYYRKTGKLDCEVCGFDFYKTYGELGKGFIEAHHRVPLSEIDGERITSLDELALVCSNCHKMLHRKINSLSVEKLKEIIKK